MKKIKNIIIIPALEYLIFYYLTEKSNLNKTPMTLKEIEVNVLKYSGNPLRVRQILKNLIKENILIPHGYRLNLISQRTYTLNKKKLKILIEDSIHYKISYNIIWEEAYKLPFPSHIKLTRTEKEK